MPLKNRQSRLSTNPEVPPTNCTTRPEQSTEAGTRTAELKIAALSLSSGTHSPPRRFLHFLTMWSERRPENTPPTAHNVRQVKACDVRE